MPRAANSRNPASSTIKTRSRRSARTNNDSTIGSIDSDMLPAPTTAAKLPDLNKTGTARLRQAPARLPPPSPLPSTASSASSSALELALARINQISAVLHAHSDDRSSLVTSWRHLRHVFDTFHVASQAQSQAADTREWYLARAWRTVAFHAWAFTKVNHCDAVFSVVSRMPGVAVRDTLDEQDGSLTDYNSAGADANAEHQHDCIKNDVADFEDPDQDSKHSGPNKSSDVNSDNDVWTSSSPQATHATRDVSMPRRLRSLARTLDTEAPILDMMLGMHGVSSSRHAVLGLTRLVKQRRPEGTPSITLHALLKALDDEHRRIAALGKASLRQVSPQTLLRHVISNLGGQEAVFRSSRPVRRRPFTVQSSSRSSHESETESHGSIHVRGPPLASKAMDLDIGVDQEQMRMTHVENDHVAVQQDELDEQEHGQEKEQKQNQEQAQDHEQDQEQGQEQGQEQDQEQVNQRERMDEVRCRALIFRADYAHISVYRLSVLSDSPIELSWPEPSQRLAQTVLHRVEALEQLSTATNQDSSDSSDMQSRKRLRLSSPEPSALHKMLKPRSEARGQGTATEPHHFGRLCRNLWRLEAGEWLNDSIVNTLMSRFRSSAVGVVNSLALDAFLQGNYSSSEKDTSRARFRCLGIWLPGTVPNTNLPTSIRLVLVPAFDKSRSHWVLYSFVCATTELFLYDPLPEAGTQSLQGLLTKGVEHFFQWLFKLPQPVSTRQFEHAPEQINRNDCGVYVVEVARFLSSKATATVCADSNLGVTLPTVLEKYGLDWKASNEQRLRCVLLDSVLSGAMALDSPQFQQGGIYSHTNNAAATLCDWISRQQWYDKLIISADPEYFTGFVASSITRNLLHLRSTETANIVAGFVDRGASRLHARHRRAIATAVQTDTDARRLREAETKQLSLLVQFIETRNSLRDVGLLPAFQPQHQTQLQLQLQPQPQSPLPLALGAVEAAAAAALMLLPGQLPGPNFKRGSCVHASKAQSAWALCVAYTIILHKMDVKERPIRQRALQFHQEQVCAPYVTNAP
ncbi:hypothetical protein BD289DRAFT_483672 [Coniella lustricola]|uniref:Ubiquitin-like protease family profile domain-containing protein n=1 Tax=Coniella lustricola TaxID=2025994 RepID=A0A2T3A4L3_9PEZI|nr:hypothetical protein BD289DRAFT_483672 [Coniella lustricola]